MILSCLTIISKLRYKIIFIVYVFPVQSIFLEIIRGAVDFKVYDTRIVLYIGSFMKIQQLTGKQS
jgi:hypothetical protein